MAINTVSSYIVANERASELPLVHSVPIPGGKKKPQGRFVGIFGNKDTLKYFSSLRAKANEESTNILRVDCEVEGNTSHAGKYTEKSIPSLKFLNLTFAHSTLLTRLHEIFSKYYRREINPLQLIKEDPRVLNFIWDDDYFSHLSIIAWTSSTFDHRGREVGKIQLAAIRSEECVLSKFSRNFTGDQSSIKLAFNESDAPGLLAQLLEAKSIQFTTQPRWISKKNCSISNGYEIKTGKAHSIFIDLGMEYNGLGPERELVVRELLLKEDSDTEMRGQVIAALQKIATDHQVALKFIGHGFNTLLEGRPLIKSTANDIFVFDPKQ